MPKVHNIGTKYFVQFIDFPVKWESKLMVRGWTQEIDEPFRTSSPFIFRMPKYKALVVGKWAGAQLDEETALNNAMQGRVLKDEDFEEGWTPAAYQDSEEGSEHLNT